LRVYSSASRITHLASVALVIWNFKERLIVDKKVLNMLARAKQTIKHLLEYLIVLDLSDGRNFLNFFD
jgi:hypothetical protein